MKRLTLSLDEKTIAKAKRLAAHRRTSVSAMFAQFVKTASRKRGPQLDVPKDSIAARVGGIMRLPRGKTDRDVLTEALMEKYGIKR